MDAGCPVGRDELTDQEWFGVAAIKAERDRMNMPKPEDAGWQKVPGQEE